MRLSQLARLSISVACLALSGLAFGQTKWDLASGYPPGNFHTENLEQFTKDVDAATQGKLKITLHSNASLFKLPEIWNCDDCSCRDSSFGGIGLPAGRKRGSGAGDRHHIAKTLR